MSLGRVSEQAWQESFSREAAHAGSVSRLQGTMESQEIELTQVADQEEDTACLDPISFEPLTKAVTLVPCCHKVNEDSAVKMFGKIGEDSHSTKGNCPMCRTSVTAYYQDHQTREFVQMLLTRRKDQKGLSLRTTTTG